MVSTGTELLRFPARQLHLSRNTLRNGDISSIGPPSCWDQETEILPCLVSREERAQRMSPPGWGAINTLE